MFSLQMSCLRKKVLCPLLSRAEIWLESMHLQKVFHGTSCKVTFRTPGYVSVIRRALDRLRKVMSRNETVIKLKELTKRERLP